ncbi:unnamed protein product [Laminaria digitata]
MGVAVILNLVVTVVINSFWDEYKTTNNPALALRQLQDAAAASARLPPLPGAPCSNATQGGGGGGGGGGVGGGSETGSARSDIDVSGGLEGGRGRSAVDPRFSRDNNYGGSWRVGFSHEEDGVEDVGVGTRGGGGSARVGGGSDGVGGGGGVGGRSGSVDGGGGDVRLHRGHQQSPQAMPNGDQEGMEAERDIVRRASRRRLNVSGIA